MDLIIVGEIVQQVEVNHSVAILAIASLVSTVVGGLIQTYSGYQQAKQSQFNAEAEADVISKQAAQEEINRIEQEKNKRRKESKSKRSRSTWN